MFVLISFSAIVCAQEIKSIDTSEETNYNSQKGKFHFAIQGFGMGDILSMKTSYYLNARLGYMLTDYDMLFISGKYSWNPREYMDRTFELGLNYRRYFREYDFRPFVQSGIGLGYVNYSDDYTVNDQKSSYGIFDVGVGVSYKYKRWQFELGIKSEYNRNKTGRMYLMPLWGISFTF
jgi:hypothetical protein